MFISNTPEKNINGTEKRNVKGWMDCEVGVLRLSRR
jgi:hypothetical protein